MNSLYQQMMVAQAPQNNISQLKNIINMFRNSNNPQQLLMNMAQQNPKVQQVMNLIQNSGRPPKELFYQMAQQKGVNADQLIAEISKQFQ